MGKDKNKLVLIDGHSTLHKAYHGIDQSLTNSRGEPTSAIYGFLNSFMRLSKELEFSHVVVVFDPPTKTFRSEMYEEYKAHRPPMPDDLRSQDKRVREMLTALNVPMIMIDRYEADDAIACLANLALENGGEAIVVSSDKDLLQIVRPGITVWREHLQRLEVLDTDGVIKKLGVTPEQVPAYLGLVGDAADNIPGVPKIGPKSAVNLLQEYGDLESILTAEEPWRVRLNKTQAANLRDHSEDARLSTELATLKTDCIQEFDWNTFAWKYEPTQALRDFYKELEFFSQLNSLGGESVEERTTDYRNITTKSDLEKCAAEIRKAGLASIDTETTELDPFLAELVGISISWALNQAIYIPLGHNSADTQLTLEEARQVLGPLLADEKIQWVAHHWQFDFKILSRAGFEGIDRIHGDTMIASYLLHPERSSQNSLRLKDMALQRLGIQMTEIKELIGDGDDMVTMASVTVEDSGEYACQDADVTLQLHNQIEPQLAEAEMADLFNDVELPLIPVLARMELEGVRLDTAHFKNLSKEWQAQSESLTDEIYQIAGHPFNINSPKQVGTVLFEELNLTPLTKTKSGYSTDVATLEALRNDHELPAKLLEYRQIEKLRGTYVDPLPRMINPVTGRIHTSYNQTIAATGRLSSMDPNLQNIPIRTEEGRRIREGFLPRQDGWKLLSADYSQVELRILAHLSQDETLVHAFNSGEDVHTITACRMFKVDAADVTEEMRSRAKVINFGIIYGISAFRLSNEFKISQEEAKAFISSYFEVYSGVKQFIDDTIASAKEHRFVTTMLGRRRSVPDISSRNFNQRSGAERIAVNTPVQGTSADMIKLAMLRIDKRLRDENFQGKMILQVHDELIFDAPETELDALTEMVREEMRNALPLDVPIKVDVSIGSNWAEC